MLSSEDGLEDVEMESCDGEANLIPTASPSSSPVNPDTTSSLSYLRHSFKGDKNLAEEMNELKDILGEPRLQKRDHLALAEIRMPVGLSELTVNKGKVKEQFGFDVNTSTYLWPEEALYLIETNKLEVFCSKVALSIQRARSLFLRPTNQPHEPDAIQTCTTDEYNVYKNLSNLGYKVKRKPAKDVKPKVAKASDVIVIEPDEDENVGRTEGASLDLFEDKDVMFVEASDSKPTADDHIRIKFPTATFQKSGVPFGKVINPMFGTTATTDSRRGLKRRASIGLVSDEDSSGSSHLSLKQDTDIYYADLITKSDEILNADPDTFEIRSTVSFTIADEEIADVAKEPVAGPSSGARSTLSVSYIVVEADSDSDIEIVDEVIHSHIGVSIEEIGTYQSESEYGDDEDLEGAVGYSLPSANLTPTSHRVIVDLVSDESDSDIENDFEVFDVNIFSRFIPNAKVQLKFPPSYLLPYNIPSRGDNIYEFNLKTKSTTSPDLENIVEDLNLEGSPKAKADEKVHCNSWKEWRQLIMSEARDVLNESLLANSGQTSDVFKKLHLWENVSTKSNENNSLQIPFDLFSPAANQLGKRKLGSEVSPIFHVAIVRTEEEVIKFSNCDTEDEIPLLFAIVSDDGDILFLTPNMTPLPSIF